MRISESYHQVKKNQQAIQENHVGELPHHSAVNSDLSDVFHAARHEFGFIRSNNGGHEGATKHSVGSSVTHSVHTSGGSHLRQKLKDVINQHKNDGGVGANNFRNGGMAIINTKEGHKHIIQAQYGTHHSVYSHSINHAVTESTIDEATKPAEPKALRKWNVGDMVHPKVGPHKGEAHKVIHVHPDGSMNIVPQVAVHAQNKYRLGAARCTDEQIDVPVSDKQKAGLDKRNAPKKEKEIDSHEHVAVRDVEGKFAGRFKSMKDAQTKHKGGGVTFHPIKLSEEFEPLAEDMEEYEEVLDEGHRVVTTSHNGETFKSKSFASKKEADDHHWKQVQADKSAEPKLKSKSIKVVKEGEEVNEVSKDLLRKYFNLAASSRSKADKADDVKTVAKRDRGIGNAFDKLHEDVRRPDAISHPKHPKAYVEPYESPYQGQSGYKSSDKHGHIKFWNEHGKASAHKHAGITEEVVEEGLKRIGAYTTKDGAIMTMHTSENDPKHHMLVTAGKVVASHHGTPQEFHNKLRADGISGALNESPLNEIATSRLLLVTAANKPKTDINELSVDTLRHYSKKSIDQLRANKGNRDFASKAKKRDNMVNTACQKVVGDEKVKVKATNEETIEEGFSVGDMVRASNPKATPKYKVVGKNATHYELQRPDGGRGNISLSKARVHKVNLDGKRLTESELNELSRTGMGQYIYKASNDRTKQTGDPKKYGNRLKGISLAVNKIADKNKKIRLGVTEGLATHHIHIEDSKGKSHGKIGIKAWDDEMAQRHAERIVGNKPFRGMKVSKITRINEDQIDELSTKTLTNYVKAKRIQQKDYPTPEAFRKAVESQATARKKLTEGELNELSTKTLGSYIGKAHAALPAHQRRAEGALAILQHNGPKKPGESTSATGARDWAKKEFVQHDTKRFNRNAGIAKAARKLSEEENMTVNLLDEAKRGRPRKNPVIGGVDDNEREHITMQLRKSVSLNGVKPIRFADNSQHTVSPEHAERVLSHYAGLAPDHKEQFQKHIDASHTNMMNYKAFKPTAAQSDIPTARPLNHRTVKKPIERRPLMLSPYEKRANMIRTAVAKQKAKAKA